MTAEFMTDKLLKSLRKMVGAAGFEPATYPCKLLELNEYY